MTGMVPYKELNGVADPLSRALELSGFKAVGWIVALGAAVSMSAVLLVFQYGQPRIFFAMARDGLLPRWAAKIHPRTRIPWATTLLTGIFVALWSLVGDAGETYDLTNIGTLFAFILVSIGVLVLRHKEPERPRPFRVPMVWPVCLLSAAGCVFIMIGLPHQAWVRFGIWLVIGLHLYFCYGLEHSAYREMADPRKRVNVFLVGAWIVVAVVDFLGIVGSLSPGARTFAFRSGLSAMWARVASLLAVGRPWVGALFWAGLFIVWGWFGWRQLKATPEA
jgi:amino acid transporter